MRKILIAVLLVFYSSISFSSEVPWLCESHFDDYVNNVAGDKIFFNTKYNCETTTLETCYDTTGKEDFRRHKLELGAIVVDTVASVQADTDDAVASTEVTNRGSKRTTRESSLQSCISSVPNASVVDDLKDCLLDAIKQLEESRTAEADL